MCREILDNVLSGTKAGFKATRNLVFNQKAERSTMNRQKSRGIVENVLSGMKAGFKSILNYEHPFERKKMNNQKSSSTFSATLLALILGASVFMAGPVWAAKQMVIDPGTGKMITAPQYGGTLTYALASFVNHTDSFLSHGAGLNVDPVLDRLGISDWAIDREKVANYAAPYVPLEALRGNLAESWSQPDDKTLIFKIRQGVHLHDKAPVNGRALVADDLAYNYQRLFGIGRFAGKEKAPQTFGILALPIESVEATDKTTLVVKLKQPSFGALAQLFDDCHGYVYAPEIIEEHGNAEDWRTVVGTGPFTITDIVEGTSVTWEKNPHYWKNDEKFPQNRLPYLDKLVALIMTDPATRLAAMRSGKIDYTGHLGNSQVPTIDTAVALKKSNPQIVQWPFAYRSYNSFAISVNKPPFNDIRVRQALQMALDLETIHDSYHQGYGEWLPQGMVGSGMKGYNNPFETWPAEVQKTYSYDPEGAEKLLDEAGYPRGADGIRFKTNLYTSRASSDTGYRELAAGYWSKIGVEVEVNAVDDPQMVNLGKGQTVEGFMDFTNIGADYGNLGQLTGIQTTGGWNPGGISDPVYDAKVDAVRAATSLEEQKRLVKEADMYAIQQKWFIWGSRTPQFNLNQPWVVGYSGETQLGSCGWGRVFTRLWIDQDLKKEMGY